MDKLLLEYKQRQQRQKPTDDHQQDLTVPGNIQFNQRQEQEQQQPQLPPAEADRALVVLEEAALQVISAITQPPGTQQH